MKFKEDCLAQCPYYREDLGPNLRCEGIGKNVGLPLNFGNLYDLRRYKDALCRGQWTDCPLAQMHCRRYNYIPVWRWFGGSERRKASGTGR